MSYRIQKAQKMQSKIMELQTKIKLNERALSASIVAGASKYIIEDFQSKAKKLQREYEKASKRFFAYADDNIKVSELKKLEDKEELYEDYY